MQDKLKTIKNELAGLINSHSLENGSNTPDFILAAYLLNCLAVFDHANNWNTAWHSKDGVPENWRENGPPAAVPAHDAGTTPTAAVNYAAIDRGWRMFCQSCGTDAPCPNCEVCGALLTMVQNNDADAGTDGGLPTDRRPCPNCGRSDGWHLALGHPPLPVGDSRKIVWMRDKDEMEWWGVRAYNHAEGYWQSNSREESSTVLFWMETPHSPHYPPASHAAESAAPTVKPSSKPFYANAECGRCGASLYEGCEWIDAGGKTPAKMAVCVKCFQEQPRSQIRTCFVNPPIPIRNFDWVAWIDGEEEGHRSHGRTEQEAKDELCNLLAQFDAESTAQLDAEDPAEPGEDGPQGYVKLEDVEKAILAQARGFQVIPVDELAEFLKQALAPKPSLAAKTGGAK